MSDPLIALQEKLSHLDRRLEQLNEVVTEMSLSQMRHQRQVTLLEEEIKRLKKGEPDAAPADEKPPHY